LNTDNRFAISELPGSPKSPLTVCDIEATSCLLEWKLTDKDGGSPITGYVIEASLDGKEWNKFGQTDRFATNFKPQNLQTGKKYTFRVATVNDLGLSKPLTGDVVLIAKPAGMWSCQLICCHC